MGWEEKRSSFLLGGREASEVGGGGRKGRENVGSFFFQPNGIGVDS